MNCCEECGTRYVADLDRCPNCGSRKRHRFGEPNLTSATKCERCADYYPDDWAPPAAKGTPAAKTPAAKKTTKTSDKAPADDTSTALAT